MVIKFLEAVTKYGESSSKKRLAVDATVVVIVLAVAFLLYRGASLESGAARDGKQAHDYLCYQKTVVIPGRMNDTFRYIADVQAGRRKPIPGLTNSDLQNSINRDQAALAALSRVHC